MMIDDLHIHPITVEDFDAWFVLWTGYLRYYETELPDEMYHLTFKRILEGNAAAEGSEYEPRGLIAYNKGRPVGIVHFLYQRHCWREGHICYLQDLYTDKKARGKGVGRALIEAVYRKADYDKCPDVYWMTQHFNTPGRRLYDQVAKLTPFVKYQRQPRR